MFYLQRKYKIETEVENWIQKYDTDMGERQVRLIYFFFHSREQSQARQLCMNFPCEIFREFDTVEAADD